MNFKGFLVLLLISAFLPLHQSNASDGVKIEPAIQKIFLNDQGQPRESLQKIHIKNDTALELNFSLKAVEFTDIDKNGGNIFLGQSLSEGEFKAASWVELSENQVFLTPGEDREITFEFKDVQSLLPGAHYGAILFETIRPDSDQGTDPAKIFLRQIATSLLYVNKGAGEEHKYSVASLVRYRTFPKLVDSVVLTVANEGTGFIEPRGYVEIKNLFGNSVGRASLNDTTKTLFPGQIREIEARFEKVNYFLPGPYTFTAYSRIGEEAYQKTVLTVWYWEPIAAFFGVAFAFLLLFILMRFIFAKKSR